MPNRAKLLAEIVEKKYKIIVCVDMLGEGFDLPELKIAAIHDQHRSPAVTLQFIGRLTRVDDTLGDAKFVSNIANQKVDYQMAVLYKESADWSAVIRDVSQDKIAREIEKETFTEQFPEDADAEDIFGLNPTPKISAIAYHVELDDWRPEKAKHFSQKKEPLQLLSINGESDTIMGVKIVFAEEGSFEQYLDTNPLVLLAVDGSMVEGNYRYFSPNSLDLKLPVALIEAWDWGTTQIHSESMRADRNPDTVQGFTYSRIEDDYTFIFNDDGAGEIADLVAIKESKDAIFVDLYHCKYCPQQDGEARPGARVSDVYEVCGQA